MTQSEFDRHLGEMLRSYPDLKDEILQSVVYDEREAIVAREMVERSIAEDDR